MGLSSVSWEMLCGSFFCVLGDALWVFLLCLGRCFVGLSSVSWEMLCGSFFCVLGDALWVFLLCLGRCFVGLSSVSQYCSQYQPKSKLRDATATVNFLLQSEMC